MALPEYGAEIAATQIVDDDENLVRLAIGGKSCLGRPVQRFVRSVIVSFDDNLAFKSGAAKLLLLFLLKNSVK